MPSPLLIPTISPSSTQINGTLLGRGRNCPLGRPTASDFKFEDHIVWPSCDLCLSSVCHLCCHSWFTRLPLRSLSPIHTRGSPLGAYYFFWVTLLETYRWLSFGRILFLVSLSLRYLQRAFLWVISSGFAHLLGKNTRSPMLLFWISLWTNHLSHHGYYM